jgi:uncharacterized protein
MKLRAVVSLLLVFGLWPATERAQGQQIDSVRVQVAPDVELFTIVQLPEGEGPFPVVLLRNPYRTRGGSMGWLAERLLPYGYAVVEQDVRGTGESPGTFIPFAFDVADGTATLDWLADQPWAGPVGLWGISYLGWAAYALAETGHPAIEALVVGSAWADMAPFLWPGGAFNLQAHLTWLLGFGGGGGMPSPAVLDSIFRTLPLEPLLARAQGVMAMAEHPYRWEAVGVPVLHFTGWYDYIYRDALRGYEALRAAGSPASEAGTGSPQRLIVGAWAHNGEMSGTTRVGDVDFGPAAGAGVDSVAAWSRRFLDVHLKGLAEVDHPVRVFVTGANEWRALEDWPPPEASVRSWHLGADGGLSTATEARAGNTTVRYDPDDPVPTVGGVNSHFFPENLGPLDQRSLDGRSDVATFLAPALERPLMLAGPLRAVLYLEADAPSTDVVVKVIAEAPDGTARLIEDGIRRLPHVRAGVNEVTVELGHRAQLLEPGVRLRVDVTGGNFPKYDRNPNTGEDPLTATTLRPVSLRIHHGPDSPSRLEATVLPE